MKPILTLAGELAARKTTSQALVEDALMRIALPSGEGARVFLRTRRESALAEAQASDALRLMLIQWSRAVAGSRAARPNARREAS